jgi:hypothetical protein
LFWWVVLLNSNNRMCHGLLFWWVVLRNTNNMVCHG